MTTNYPYFSNPESPGLLYNVFDIDALWIPDTFCLSINKQVKRGYQVCITPTAYHSPAFQGTEFRWTAAKRGNFLGSLKNGAALSGNNKPYIGEGVNEVNSLIVPPECILTYTPVMGENVEAYSKIFSDPTAEILLQDDFHWCYRTIEHPDVWGDFTDCWRTGLWEYSSNGVYNYVFSLGIGLVDFWYGLLGADNHVIGQRYYCKGTL